MYCFWGEKIMDGFQNMMALATFVNLALIGLGIYSLVLFIKLARRGIKALDIYINEKTNNK